MNSDFSDNFDVGRASSPEELSGIIKLRYKVLREPWHQSFESSADEHETESVNACIVQNGEVIACGRLQKIDSATAQIRYMAVDPAYRGKGLGKSILNYLEKSASEMGISRIMLQARENAVDFYLRQGFTNLGKSFLLWGLIQHFEMDKEL